jgi:hypothetical protein
VSHKKQPIVVDPKFKADVTAKWHEWRQRCRTDLYDLCKILGYNDVCPEVHGQMVDALQKFKGGRDWRDEISLDGSGYSPYVPDFWQLRGNRKNLILISRDHLKALDVNTPIPTPEGWVRMGEIQEGDFVLGGDGKPARVIAASPIKFSTDVYEVEFSTGDILACDGDHLWLTDSKFDRERKSPRGPAPSVKTTTEIAQSLLIHAGERNHRVPVATPLRLADKKLPIPPYALGVWLGDGNCSGGVIHSNDQQVIDDFAACGEPIRRIFAVSYKYVTNNPKHKDYRHHQRSFAARLRKMGLINNKHIPAEYLRGSLMQRLELMQGLMDTDGSASKSGQCFFTNMNERLVKQLRELACSLGYKASPVYHWQAMLNGVDHGTCYTISFYATPSVNPFKLKRKADRIYSPKKGSRHGYRQIVAVRQAADRLVRCIAVDSPGNLYLAGEGFIPTHNTSVATVAHSIQWVINYPNIRILISSGTGDQARGFLRAIKQHFTENEMFRFLFPEFCPQKNVKDFGNQEQFNVPNRTLHTAKEPTFKTCSSESVVSSGHYDIHKNDDLVDKETVKTSEQIATIKRHFAMLDPLLERNQRSAETVKHGWVDVIGTIYHFNDLHNALYLAEMEKPKEQRQWNIVKLSAAPNYPRRADALAGTLADRRTQSHRERPCAWAGNALHAISSESHPLQERTG